MSAPAPQRAVEGVPTDAEVDAILAHAAERGRAMKLDYAGAVTPGEAWGLLQRQAASLVDVRTAAEFKFVGRIAGTQNIEWNGVAAPARTGFLTQLRALAAPERPLLLLCRSGVRSHAAAIAATEAGYARVYNVLEGFEGQLDAAQQRGKLNGWRFHGLPWVQD